MAEITASFFRHIKSLLLMYLSIVLQYLGANAADQTVNRASVVKRREDFPFYDVISLPLG